MIVTTWMMKLLLQLITYSNRNEKPQFALKNFTQFVLMKLLLRINERFEVNQSIFTGDYNRSTAKSVNIEQTPFFESLLTFKENVVLFL